jgi:hypothetical protein
MFHEEQFAVFGLTALLRHAMRGLPGSGYGGNGSALPSSRTRKLAGLRRT